MTARLLAVAGLAVLAVLWLGPLPHLATRYFSAHMTLHMGVVAVAAPLVALGIAGSRRNPVARWPACFSPVAASITELVVVWGWHAPAAHHAARARFEIFALEQGTFLAAGLWLWLSACDGPRWADAGRAWAGVAGLLFTSIHMTLLGALFALAPRVLYGPAGVSGTAALADQHLGGSVMLLVGGLSYLMGGLWLARGALAGARDSAAVPARDARSAT